MGTSLNEHGVLGDWAVVCFGFSIASIISSLFVIITVVVTIWKRPSMYSRTTYRLSGWLAVYDIIYSACQICTFYNEFMSNRTEIQLRIIHWFMAASTMSYASLSACIGVQLMFCIFLKRRYIYERIEKWFELISFIFGFTITHSIMYTYTEVQWTSSAQMFHIFTDPAYYKAVSWGTKWVWLFMFSIWGVVVTTLVVAKMSKTAVGVLKECKVDGDSDSITTIEVKNRFFRRVILVVLRYALYTLSPMLTQIWTLAANMAPRCPMWLFIVANIMPTTQGIINMLLFVLNPGLDGSRSSVWQRYTSKYSRKQNTSLDGGSNTDFSPNGGSISRQSTISSILYDKKYSAEHIV